MIAWSIFESDNHSAAGILKKFSITKSFSKTDRKGKQKHREVEIVLFFMFNVLCDGGTKYNRTQILIEPKIEQPQ
jgi:hypothetical protein